MSYAKLAVILVAAITVAVLIVAYVYQITADHRRNKDLIAELEQIKVLQAIPHSCNAESDTTSRIIADQRLDLGITIYYFVEKRKVCVSVCNDIIPAPEPCQTHCFEK